MAKGMDRHKERQQAVSLLGKPLARRAKSTCELCSARGVPLTIYEVSPVLADPDAERALFLCEICRSFIENPKRENPDHWRCLGNAIWSELPPTLVMAVRILRRLEPEYHWAADLLEEVYLDPDIEEWVDAGTL